MENEAKTEGNKTILAECNILLLQYFVATKFHYIQVGHG